MDTSFNDDGTDTEWPARSHNPIIVNANKAMQLEAVDVALCFWQFLQSTLLELLSMQKKATSACG